MKKINWLFVFHILTHISLVYMILYASPIHFLISFIVYFLTGSIGMSATYHRYLSHKSYKANKWWEYFGSLCGTLGGTGSTIAWVAVHREHHRFTDTDQDPHCPYHKGFFKVQFLSMFYKPNIRYVPDLLRSKFHQILHKFYWVIHLIYATICFSIDPFSLVYAYLFPSLILWHAGSSINTLSHFFGTNDNETKDKSKNHWFTGIFVWGEGWHNNHHSDPTNYKFGKNNQIDITAKIINMVKI